MTEDHPINNIKVSSNIMFCLLNEYEYLIHSKRLKSKIFSISDLLKKICNRNSHHMDLNIFKHITKHFPCIEEINIINSYIQSLFNIEANEIESNVYGKICFRFKAF